MVNIIFKVLPNILQAELMADSVQDALLVVWCQWQVTPVSEHHTAVATLFRERN